MTVSIGTCVLGAEEWGRVACEGEEDFVEHWKGRLLSPSAGGKTNESGRRAGSSLLK